MNCGASSNTGWREQGSLWGEGSRAQLAWTVLLGHSEGQKGARGSVAAGTLVPAKALEPVGTAPEHGLTQPTGHQVVCP